MFAVTGTGVALPEQSYTSRDLERIHSLNAGFLEAAPGVACRHYIASETQIDLAARAAHDALGAAGLSPGDVDLIVHASAVPYQPLPITSTRILQALGIPGGAIETFDINTTCLSFLTAFEKVALLIGAGRYRRALVVSSETPSRGLPWKSEPRTAALFGDGAAAAVLEPGTWTIRASRFRSFPDGWEHCQLKSGGTRIDFRKDPEGFSAGSTFTMDGRAIFRETIRHFPAFLDLLLEQAGWSINDVGTVIPHQASPHALSHIKKQLSAREGQFIETIQETGNMIAASLPYCLHSARTRGRIAPGERILMLGVAAGLSIGGVALEVTA